MNNSLQVGIQSEFGGTFLGSPVFGVAVVGGVHFRSSRTFARPGSMSVSRYAASASFASAG
mgnify:FL=1